MNYLLYHSVLVGPKRPRIKSIKIFLLTPRCENSIKRLKKRLTNNANYQQQLWEKIVRFWSHKKNLMHVFTINIAQSITK